VGFAPAFKTFSASVAFGSAAAAERATGVGPLSRPEYLLSVELPPRRR